MVIVVVRRQDNVKSKFSIFCVVQLNRLVWFLTEDSFSRDSVTIVKCKYLAFNRVIT